MLVDAFLLNPLGCLLEDYDRMCGEDSGRQVTHPVFQACGQLSNEPDVIPPCDQTLEENDLKEGFLLALC